MTKHAKIIKYYDEIYEYLRLKIFEMYKDPDLNEKNLINIILQIMSTIAANTMCMHCHRHHSENIEETFIDMLHSFKSNVVDEFLITLNKIKENEKSKDND